ncbi:DUF3857 and transglutaminase domain-containing protein [bacterium]|nr:DUF3857 and transglutaminase domain-containing protein [bacterium]
MPDSRVSATRAIALCIALLVLCLTSNLTASPDWVKEAIEAAEGVTPQADAIALIIAHTAEIEISKNGSSTTKVRRAVKVLSPQGADDAYLSVPTSSYSKVKGLKGWRIESGGAEEKLDDEYIVEVAPLQSAGYYIDMKLVSVLWPDIKTGDVFAYEYELDEKEQFDGFFQRFLFQKDLPVLSARLTVTLPDNWELHASEQNLDPVTSRVEDGRYIWEAGYMAYCPEEPYMPPWRYVLRQILLSCYDPSTSGRSHFVDWDACGSWTSLLYREPMVCDSVLAAEVMSIVGQAATPSDRLQAVATYVRDRIRYVAVEIGDGRFEPRAASETFANSYGDCKDKATLMRAMLSVLDIPSSPALASVGSTVDKDFPSPFQFNHVIVAVPTSSITDWPSESHAVIDGWLYFDPTDPAISLGDLPPVLYGGYVLRAADSTSGLTRLPRLEPTDRMCRNHATITLAPDMTVTAQMTVTDIGANAASIAYHRATTPVSDQLEELHRRFSTTIPNAVISDYSFASDSDSTWAAFTLVGDAPVTCAGDMTLLSVNVFETDSFENLPKGERVHPIWFGAARTVESEIDWILPDGWRVAEIPDTIWFDGDPGSVHCVCEGTGSHISVVSTQTRKGWLLDSENYASARRFVRTHKKSADMTIMLTLP